LKLENAGWQWQRATQNQLLARRHENNYLSMLKIELWQKNEHQRDGVGELRANK
jgi:hypothetical protein